MDAAYKRKGKGKLKYQKKQELLLYAVIWGVLFLIPLMDVYVRTLSDGDFTFEWNEVLHDWKDIGGFCVIFAIHNLFIAPLLVYQKRRMAYTVAVTVVLAIVVAWRYGARMEQHGPNEPSMEEQRVGDHKPSSPPHDDSLMYGEGMTSEMPPADRPVPPEPRDLPPAHKKEPPMAGRQDVVEFTIRLLMLGLNVYVKYYFRLADERKRLKDLEKQNLEHQLEYLKYQINPHFFMNTLNNIHALVDIDPELAKNTIVELSKLMRFVLYEGAKQKVPLQREIDFIRNYIRLMRIRYADSVAISMEVGEPMPDTEVPPLITIAFVENAFKHGVSYKHDSFIKVCYTFAGEKMVFTCLNSKREMQSEEHGGVGLENVRRRLNLIYGDRYSLRIADSNATYNVELTIPL